MLLKGKIAVVYDSGGLIGSAVARAFAQDGAKVQLAGRTMAKLDALAEEISVVGGAAEAAQRSQKGSKETTCASFNWTYASKITACDTVKSISK